MDSNNNNNVNTINKVMNTINDHLSDSNDNLTQEIKKAAWERIVAKAKFELRKLDKKVVSELRHFEDLPGILQI